MHLENSVKLDFKDVLIRPKRSTLTSRSEVDITREFKFLHSSEPYHGIPIIAANMDTTGTFEMASALGRHKMSTALHKHYTAKEYVDFFHKLENKSDAFYSLGIGEHDWQKFREVMAAAPGAIRYVCIDVANGYTAVSYTHLRAHETDSYLVCRLLLEKKKKKKHQNKKNTTTQPK